MMPPCGCEVDGYGTLPLPVVIRFCPTHALAPEMVDVVRKLRLSLREWQLQYDPDHTDTVTANALDECDALLARLDG